MEYLIEGTHFPLQVGQAQPADGVAASEADGEPLGLQVERLLADGAGQILCPLRRLDWHFCQLVDGTALSSVELRLRHLDTRRFLYNIH